MKQISNTEYQKLRNKLWSELCAGGLMDDNNDGEYGLFDDILGKILPVDWGWDDATYRLGKRRITETIDELEEILDTNSSRSDWTDDEVSMEMDFIYGKVYEIKKDLEKLK